MADYGFVIYKGQMVFDDRPKRQKFIDAIPDGTRGTEVLRRPRGKKTDPQLGYYWGLLLPEIRDELNRQGHTRTISYKNINREISLDTAAAHEIVKMMCARIGEDGAYTTLSEQDKYLTSRFIDNVLSFAGELGMNVELLAAKRPEEKDA